MNSICITSPFDGFQSLYNQIQDLLVEPPLFSKISVPAIINTLQDKMFSTVEYVVDEFGNLVEKTTSYISSINMELTFLIKELSEISFFELAKKMVDPLLSIAGWTLRQVFPEIPGLGFSIIDILTGKISPTEIFSKLKEAIANGLSSLWKFIPQPFRVSIDIPDIDLVQIWKLILKEYKEIILKPIKELINIVADILEVSGLGNLIPEFPSIGQIINVISSKIKNYASNILNTIGDTADSLIKFASSAVLTTYEETVSLMTKLLEKGAKISDFLSGISFDGLPEFFSIDNIFKTVKMIEVELQFAIEDMLDFFHNFNFKKLWDFVKNLPGINLIFSPLCIPLPFKKDIINNL